MRRPGSLLWYLSVVLATTIYDPLCVCFFCRLCDGSHTIGNSGEPHIYERSWVILRKIRKCTLNTTCATPAVKKRDSCLRCSCNSRNIEVSQPLVGFRHAHLHLMLARWTSIDCLKRYCSSVHTFGLQVLLQPFLGTLGGRGGHNLFRLCKTEMGPFSTH